MGFFSWLFRRKQVNLPKKEIQKVDDTRKKPVIGELPCNASKYLIHASNCDKFNLEGWDMCPEHVRMWETTASDERV